ncbi:MAG: RNA polymerase sigma factor [Acidobacteriota bacterium]
MTIEKKGEAFSDDDVIRSVKNGRSANFELIVQRYRTRIINFVFRMTGDYDESQSISQDVFLQIYKKLNKYKENGTFQAFIFTIARNITLNHIKKMNRVSFFSGFFGKGEGEYIPAGDVTPPEKIEKEERDKIVLNGLLKLNINQRLALVMKIYLEYSYKTIAEMTGWSQSKIETLISRGKVNLKNYVRLQEKGGKDV